MRQNDLKNSNLREKIYVKASKKHVKLKLKDIVTDLPCSQLIALWLWSDQVSQLKQLVSGFRDFSSIEGNMETRLSDFVEQRMACSVSFRTL